MSAATSNGSDDERASIEARPRASAAASSSVSSVEASAKSASACERSLSDAPLPSVGPRALARRQRDDPRRLRVQPEVECQLTVAFGFELPHDGAERSAVGKARPRSGE